MTLIGIMFIVNVSASHIDDTNGELSNFSYDRVVFRLQKDCSLDKTPDVSIKRVRSYILICIL